MRSLKKEERRARFFNWLSDKLADSDTQLVAILLCFFLGGLGIHRVYLKSNPIIILWYFLTLGGFFGLIPLIDFIRLIMGQVDHYEGNNSLFRAFQ
ncbi:MAG: TM2 domain-containing protein [Saprospiraceae bacterium]|nr:TM2 domain-containing protein [Haliscomenobacter sp.]MBK7223480.1 TM2 domain-containing protein [Saprospiraceae bacterium]MBK8878429.1 TM2 domain-containing protein [Haliscomenobacter sp.]